MIFITNIVLYITILYVNKRLSDLVDRQITLKDNGVLLGTGKYSTTNLTTVNKEHEYQSLKFYLRNLVFLG